MNLPLQTGNIRRSAMSAGRHNSDDYEEGQLSDHSPPHPIEVLPVEEVKSSSSEIVFETVTKPQHKPEPKKKKIHKETRSEHKEIKSDNRQRGSSTQMEREKNRDKETKNERQKSQGRYPLQHETPTFQPPYSGYPQPFQPPFYGNPQYYPRPVPHTGIPFIQNYHHPVQPYYPPFMPNYGLPHYHRPQQYSTPSSYPIPSYPPQVKQKPMISDYSRLRQAKQQSEVQVVNRPSYGQKEKVQEDILRAKEEKGEKGIEKKGLKEETRGLVKKLLKIFSPQEQLNILEMLRCHFKDHSISNEKNISFQTTLTWMEELTSTEERRSALERVLQVLGVGWVSGGLREKGLFRWALEDPQFCAIKEKVDILLEDPYSRLIR